MASDNVDDVARVASLANTAILTNLVAVLLDRGVLKREEITALLQDARADLSQPQATELQLSAVGIIDQVEAVIGAR